MSGPSGAGNTYLRHSILVKRFQRAYICVHQHWRSHQTCQLSFVEGKERRKRPAPDILCSTLEQRDILRNQYRSASVQGCSQVWELLIGVSTLSH